jgi:putative peptide zinc metalloprotease protein
MSAAPKLRGDLIIRQQAFGNGITLVVKDPAARRFFRFGEVEHFVAQQLDGATPLDVVRGRVEERFGQPLPEQTLRHFVEQFRRFRLLDDGTERREDELAHQRVRGSLLYIRVKAFDPDQLLDWLVTRVNVVFTRTFLLASAATIVIALAVTAVGWPQFTRDLTRLYRFDAVLLAWATLLSVTTAHELAHGVTCKRFGGRVNEIGFMLLYFQPAFYCNVSDAWLIPEKSKRLWVTFAGAYSEMLVWALATVAWRVTESDTWINFVALVIMATSGVKTLFNLNPLIKLDGYYLLSDYLEIPNLRQKSFAALKARARGLWNLSSDALRVRGREEWIYLGYGALAALYSTCLITLIAWNFGTFLMTRYGGLGFIAFAALLLTAFHRPLQRVASNATSMFRYPQTLGSWKRGPRRLVLAAFLLGVLGVMSAELKVSGDFRIVPGHNADVRAQVDGIIAQVHKDEGDAVNEGDVIVRLDDRDYRAELEKTDAEIEETHARLEMLEAGSRREELELARTELETATMRHEHGEQMYEGASRFRDAELAKSQTSVEKAEQRLQFARNELDRLRTLFDSALVSRKTVEETEELVTVRQKELEEAQGSAKMVVAHDMSDARRERDLTNQELRRAQGRLRVLLAGSRPEEIKATQAEISRLMAHRTYLQQQLQLVEVSSPAAGVIATARLKERLGERIGRGDLIAKVYEQSTVTAEIMVSEKEIADVRVGQTVVLKARAFPDKSFTSRIAAIAPAAVEDNSGLGGRAIRVMAEIDNGSHLLKAEMTGNAKIYAGRQRISDLATRRLAHYIRVEFWSWW